MADPKDGFSRGVEGCTEVEEVEVGRIDRMDVLALTAALPTRWYVTSRNERGLERMGLEITYNYVMTTSFPDLGLPGHDPYCISSSHGY